MDLSHPARDLLGENAERILHRLAMLPDGETGNRLHQLSGSSSQRSTQRLLDRLVGIGVVQATPVGNAKEYRLNRSHVLWPVIELALATAASTEEGVGEIVRRAVGPQVIAAVYGSFARREAGGHSDLDILIVWPDIEPELQETAINTIDLGIRQLTGNLVQIASITRDDLARMVALGDPLVESWKREARTLTQGTSIQALIERSKDKG